MNMWFWCSVLESDVFFCVYVVIPDKIVECDLQLDRWKYTSYLGFSRINE